MMFKEQGQLLSDPPPDCIKSLPVREQIPKHMEAAFQPIQLERYRP